MALLFELGKDKAAKGERLAPPFISCAPDTCGHLLPLPLRLLCYGKPLPIPTHFGRAMSSKEANRESQKLFLFLAENQGGVGILFC